MKKTIEIYMYLFLMWVTGITGAKNYEAKIDKLNTYMQHINNTMQFSGEIMLMQGDEILFNEAIGWSSRVWSIPNQVKNKYLIASLTKSFTAVLVLKSVQDGLLKLTDKVRHFIPELDERFKNITIEQLLLHESGLKHNQGLDNYWQQHSKMFVNQQQMIDLINQSELKFAPGTSASYSSLGYYLLGVLLERIHELAFADVLDNEILKPLTMEHTGSFNTLNIITHLNDAYHVKADNTLVRAPHRNYSSIQAAGDMYSNSTDLIKWHKALMNHHILQPVLTNKMFANQQHQYGMGWKINNESPRKYYHGGGTWGYSTYQAIYPDSNISLLILANVSTLAVDGLATAIEAIVFGQDSSLEQNSNAELTNSKLMNNKAIKVDGIDGKYQSTTSSSVLTVLRHDDQWYAQMSENPPFVISVNDKGQYYGSKVDVTFTFTTSEDEEQIVIAERTGKQFVFRKIK